MVWFKRIGLFLLTNLLVIITLSVTANILFAALGIKMGAGIQGLLIMCTIMGFSGALISLMLSKFMAKHFYGVKIIAPNTHHPEEKAILNMVHDLAVRAGLPKMPEVGIYQAPEINAFATGPSKNNSLVALSTGLLRAMNRDEVEGVIGHEVAHIANGDMVTMTLIQGIVNTFVLFLSRLLASLIANNMRSSDDDNRGGGFWIQYGLTMLFDILFTILASIAVNYFSRQREFRADAGGAKFAGRDKMIAGLRKLKMQFNQIEPDNGAAATLKISNRQSGFMALFSTHPDLSERIERLQKNS